MTPSISANPLASEGVPAWSRVGQWIRQRPVEAALAVLFLAAGVYFFAFYKVFNLGNSSVMTWAMSAWNAENDLEYGYAVLPGALAIAWYHRKELWAAPKSSSLWGLAIAWFGALLYVLAVRSLQPRLGLIALPLLCYGSVCYLWGAATARIILFPSALLLFMVPIGFLISRTVALQTLAADVAAQLSALFGIGVVANGTELRALDGSFQFEVAGGCSGIRSLTAMTMLSALYVHFTQRKLWKKAVIFGSSLLFALVGNLFRIFSVVLFARFWDPKIAAGLYHDYSGFIFFPIAVLCMLGMANLLNRDYSYWLRPVPAPAEQPKPVAAKAPGDEKKRGVISYDY